MQPKTDSPDLASPPAMSCWNQVGVLGDRSCPRLAEAGHCRNCSVFSEAGQRLFDREAPPEYLEEWTRQLAGGDGLAVTEATSLLVFRVGPEWLGIEARNVVEVIPPRPIHRVPHRSDRLLLGLANVRGELQLCISLHELLGIDAPPAGTESEAAPPAGSTPRLIVAEHGQNRWVFPVDEVEGVHQVPSSAMKAVPYTVERSPRYFSQAVFRHDNRSIGALSADRLFQALERTVR